MIADALPTATDPVVVSRTSSRKIFAWARPQWPSLALILALDLLAVPLALLVPLPMKLAVDSGVGSEPLPGFVQRILPPGLAGSPSGALVLAVALLLGTAAAGQAVAFAGAVLRARTRERITLGLRRRLFPHVQRLALSFHDSRGTADSVYRVLYDTEALPAAVIDGWIPLVSAGLTLAGMLCVTFVLSPALALVACVVGVLLALVSPPFLRRLRLTWEEGKTVASTAHAALQEVLGALRTVLVFGREKDEERRLVELAERGMRIQVAVSKHKALFDMTAGLLIAAGVSAVLWIGVNEVRAGALSLGELLVVGTYAVLLYGPMETMLKKAGDVQAALASVDRVAVLLAEPPAVVERPGARVVARAAGEIVFEDVVFSHAPDRAQALDRVSFRVPAGACLGIVGATGAGKTTLLHLLTRLHDPTRGRILLDGSDLRDLALASLRDQFAVVPQEAVLFSTTIAENVAYGRPGASAAEIRAAVSSAELDAFVAALPDGLDTLVGERGMQVSGGERQRIAIARAFLRDAPILLLDEPTSSIDLLTEAAIMASLRRLIRGRTTILVTHRPSLLELCDEILHMEGGRASGAAVHA